MASKNRPQSPGESLRSPEGESCPKSRRGPHSTPSARIRAPADQGRPTSSPRRQRRRVATADRPPSEPAEIAHRGPETALAVPKGKSCLRSRKGLHRGPSARIQPPVGQWPTGGVRCRNPPPGSPEQPRPPDRGKFRMTASKGLSVAPGQEFGHVRHTRRSAASRWPATARKATATGNTGTDRSLAKIAHTATERVSGVPKGKSCLRSAGGPQRGSSARIWPRPVRRHDEAVGAGKCRVRTTCLSCGEAVRSSAEAAVNDLPEDNGEERVLVFHDGCQKAPVSGLPRRSVGIPEPCSRRRRGTERPCSATDEHWPYAAPKDTGAALAQPAGNLSNVHPAARCRQTARARQPQHQHCTAPRISALRGPGRPSDPRRGKVHRKGRRPSPWLQRGLRQCCVSRPTATKGADIRGKEREAKA